MPRVAGLIATCGLALHAAALQAAPDDYRNFDSHQFRPLALAPSGKLLFVANTPDNRLEIFAVDDAGLSHQGSVRVGLEPVAVAARTDSEVWVVNHLSDSVSIVDIDATAAGAVGRVRRTLLVGDEPRDIVFAGVDRQRAFISAAHRGQNSPYTDPRNPGELTTPGIGRADVWVFDVLDQGAKPGGLPEVVAALFGDTPGPLAVSPDGSRVYVGVFKSGNQTTIVGRTLICPGGEAAEACETLPGGPLAPGGLPPPNASADGVPMPAAGLIVRRDGEGWMDELGRDWSGVIRLDLPDLDVFELDAAAESLQQTQRFSAVGTVLYAMAVNPVTGRLYVANTDARNEVRFEGVRDRERPYTTTQGHLHESRITVVDTASGDVTPRHLNPHINYADYPVAETVRAQSLSMPVGLAVTPDGKQLFVAAKGSDKVAIVDVRQLENGRYRPDSRRQITIPGGGPAGLVFDAGRQRLYVATRFDNAVLVVDPRRRELVQRHLMPTPEPAAVIAGRPLFYSAYLTSGNGESSCASCHVAGDKDELAWDLGNPLDAVRGSPGEADAPGFHPLKGPMLTQTLRGLRHHGPLQWRGDRTAGDNPLDVAGALRKFNSKYVELLGRDEPLAPAELEHLVSYGLSLVPPPNPIRALDDSLTPLQAEGRDFFANTPSMLGGATCASCHVLDEAAGRYGTSGALTAVIGGHLFKVPQQRNIYERVGMFGRAPSRAQPHNSGHMGPQVRGYGFTHDGGADTVMRFLNEPVFRFSGGNEQRRAVEQYLFAYESDLRPVVGQQITLTRENLPRTRERAALLMRRALAGDAELIAHGVVGATERGFLMAADGSFRSDVAGESYADINALLRFAFSDAVAITLTAVPPGAGERMALDRNRDGVPDLVARKSSAQPAIQASQ